MSPTRDVGIADLRIGGSARVPSASSSLNVKGLAICAHDDPVGRYVHRQEAHTGGELASRFLVALIRVGDRPTHRCVYVVIELGPERSSIRRRSRHKVPLPIIRRPAAFEAIAFGKLVVDFLDPSVVEDEIHDRRLLRVVNVAYNEAVIIMPVTVTGRRQVVHHPVRLVQRHRVRSIAPSVHLYGGPALGLTQTAAETFERALDVLHSLAELACLDGETT